MGNRDSAEKTGETEAETETEQAASQWGQGPGDRDRDLVPGTRPEGSFQKALKLLSQ